MSHILPDVVFLMGFKFADLGSPYSPLSSRFTNKTSSPSNGR